MVGARYRMRSVDRKQLRKLRRNLRVVVANDDRDVPSWAHLPYERFEEDRQLPMKVRLVLDAEDKAHTAPMRRLRGGSFGRGVFLCAEGRSWNLDQAEAMKAVQRFGEIGEHVDV